MNNTEHARLVILELIASDPNGDWTVRQICERIYGQFDKCKTEAVRRALRNMSLPGTWRLGRRRALGTLGLYDPCSDARLTDLEKQIAYLEKKGWNENANACADELIKLRELKLGPAE